MRSLFPVLRRALRFLASGGVAAMLLLASPGSAAADPFAEGMRLHLDKHYVKSAEIFHALAKDGHVRSQFMLGTIYEQGLGIPSDYKAAAYWYRKAAEGGNASARYNLGVFYMIGRGVPKDRAVAASWFLKAANQGHPKAQNNLSTFYYSGVGVEKDLSEAWKWLTLSAGQLKGMGRKMVLKNREAMEKEMSAAEIEEAKRRLAGWRRVPQK